MVAFLGAALPALAGSAGAATGSSILGSLAGGAAAAGTSALLGKALGGGSVSTGNAFGRRNQFTGGGLTTGISDATGKFVISPNKERLRARRAVKQGFLDTASELRGFIPQFNEPFAARIDELGGFIDQVEPGFGRLTQSRVQAVQNQRDRAISNTAQDFAQRGILGSSLAQNALSSIESEFAQQEADVRARSFLEELDVQNKLTRERFETNLTQLEQELNTTLTALQFERAPAEFEIEELDKELAVLTKAQSNLTSVAQTSAELAAKLRTISAQGRGAFFEPFISSASGAASDFVSGLF